MRSDWMRVMATLRRSVPEELYLHLRELSQTEQRLLSAQVIAMLERAVPDEERRQQQARVLETIRRRQFMPPQGTPDSLTLLREDRAR